MVGNRDIDPHAMQTIYNIFKTECENYLANPCFPFSSLPTVAPSCKLALTCTRWSEHRQNVHRFRFIPV